MNARDAYNAGWRASSNGSDLDRAERGYIARHGRAHEDDWLDGWMDAATDRPKWSLFKHRHEGATDPRI